MMPVVDTAMNPHAASDSTILQGWLEGLAAAQDRLQSAGASLGGVTAQCGLLAVTFGFLFQVTHNVGFLPVSIHRLQLQHDPAIKSRNTVRCRLLYAQICWAAAHAPARVDNRWAGSLCTSGAYTLICCSTP